MAHMGSGARDLEPGAMHLEALDGRLAGPESIVEAPDLHLGAVGY